MKTRFEMPSYSALLATAMAAGCATVEPFKGDGVYVAEYHPLVATQETGVIVALTAALGGTLALREGCMVIVDSHDPGSEPVLPAFRLGSVRAVTRKGKAGLQDISSGKFAFPGDRLTAGGGSTPMTADFLDRLASPPPSSCPGHVFVSNAGFGSD